MGRVTMQQTGTVSVIIPCYNHGKYLSETLDSIEASTYPRIEVIIVDDGSNNQETVDFIESCRERKIKGQYVKILKQENQGPATARNKGINASSGNFILLLDADDKIDETYIEKCIWVLTKYPHISIVYPSVQHFGDQKDIWHAQPYDFRLLLDYNYLVVSAVFKKELWEKIDGFDEKIPGYEDWDFWIRAGSFGYEGYWLREPLFFYRKHNESRLNRDNQQRKKLISFIKEKNSQIYREAAKSINGRQENKSLVQKLATKIIRVGSHAPSFLKNIGRRIVKPILEKALRQDSSGSDTLFQMQTLEETSVDNYIRHSYEYTPNLQYIDLLTKRKSEVDRETLSILFVVPWLTVGGADKVNLDLITQFKEKGHEVHLFSTLTDKHAWHEQFKSMTSKITHLGNWFTGINELLDYTIDYIQANNIQVIQMSNSQLGYQIAHVIKKHCPHVKIVDLLHMEEPYYPFDYFRYSVRYKDAFDHRIVITSYLKEVLIDKYGETPNRVTVIPNGINVVDTYEETDYLKKVERNECVIGFVGRMEEQKLPMDFVQAANEIRKHTRHARFIMVGDGSLLKSTKDLANSLGIANCITFMGSRNDAVEIMKEEFSLLLMPSLREGLPIVGLEAFSLGIPVIATNVPGWNDIIFQDKTGFTISVGDYKKMAVSCLSLISNVEKRKEFSKNAYLLAQQSYSISKTSSNYLDIYKSLLSQDSCIS